ncbi:MAG: EAL domain-containing protein [Longimicrobiaceae bacterium]
MKILVQTDDKESRAVLEEAAASLGAELILVGGEANGGDQFGDALRSHPDAVVARVDSSAAFRALRSETRVRGIALVALCDSSGAGVAAALECGADEWIATPASAAEVAARVRCGVDRAGRAEKPEQVEEIAEHFQYEELLYDRFTGFPTLPVMMERGRELLEQNGRLTVVYVQFVRYSKLEEIYGWQKLDEVLQSTANAVRDYYDQEHGGHENLLMVSHAGDDDFIFFTHIDGPPEEAERHVNRIADGLESHIHTRLEEQHGEDVAGLFGTYVGVVTLYRNPKVRTERMIYRGIREAAQAARGVEQRERTRKVADLKAALREGDIYVEYHPIVVTASAEVYGYEALARGRSKGLRSPEVMFGVAEEANLIWELSRLCRKRAIEGIGEYLEPDQLLFINIDPHDFRDPSFRALNPEELGLDQPERIVLEITERIAITDYPKFQEYLKEFRQRGFRFAVDDAGSGYAGLGSIANLEPDFIKLDISLISDIDSNFMKQNLVETMVNFANEHDIKVIAEGVEREEEWQAVKELGVHFTQGFLFHEPKYLGKVKGEVTTVRKVSP